MTKRSKSSTNATTSDATTAAAPAPSSASTLTTTTCHKSPINWAAYSEPPRVAYVYSTQSNKPTAATTTPSAGGEECCDTPSCSAAFHEALTSAHVRSLIAGGSNEEQSSALAISAENLIVVTDTDVLGTPIVPVSIAVSEDETLALAFMLIPSVTKTTTTHQPVSYANIPAFLKTIAESTPGAVVLPPPKVAAASDAKKKRKTGGASSSKRKQSQLANEEEPQGVDAEFEDAAIAPEPQQELSPTQEDDTTAVAVEAADQQKEASVELPYPDSQLVISHTTTTQVHSFKKFIGIYVHPSRLIKSDSLGKVTMITCTSNATMHASIRQEIMFMVPNADATFASLKLELHDGSQPTPSPAAEVEPEAAVESGSGGEVAAEEGEGEKSEEVPPATVPEVAEGSEEVKKSGSSKGRGGSKKARATAAAGSASTAPLYSFARDGWRHLVFKYNTVENDGEIVFDSLKPLAPSNGGKKGGRMDGVEKITNWLLLHKSTATIAQLDNLLTLVNHYSDSHDVKRQASKACRMLFAEPYRMVWPCPGSVAYAYLRFDLIADRIKEFRQRALDASTKIDPVTHMCTDAPADCATPASFRELQKTLLKSVLSRHHNARSAPLYDENGDAIMASSAQSNGGKGDGNGGGDTGSGKKKRKRASGANADGDDGGADDGAEGGNVDGDEGDGKKRRRSKKSKTKRVKLTIEELKDKLQAEFDQGLVAVSSGEDNADAAVAATQEGGEGQKKGKKSGAGSTVKSNVPPKPEFVKFLTTHFGIDAKLVPLVSRKRILSFLWSYIRTAGLQDAVAKRNVTIDEALSDILVDRATGAKVAPGTTLDMFKLAGLYQWLYAPEAGEQQDAAEIVTDAVAAAI